MEGGGDPKERRCSCSWCCTPQKHHCHTHAHMHSTQMHTRAHAVVLRGIRRRCYLLPGTFQRAQQSPPQIQSANGPRNNQMMQAPGQIRSRWRDTAVERKDEENGNSVVRATQNGRRRRSKGAAVLMFVVLHTTKAPLSHTRTHAQYANAYTRTRSCVARRT